jgi:hypothetical protein
MPETNPLPPSRIKVFVDYWNLQLLVNQVQKEDRVSLDWQNLGEWLGKQASIKAKITTYNYEGTNIYTSYNPKKEKESYYKWITNWLNRQPGIQGGKGIKCFLTLEDLIFLWKRDQADKLKQASIDVKIIIMTIH